MRELLAIWVMIEYAIKVVNRGRVRYSFRIANWLIVTVKIKIMMAVMMSIYEVMPNTLVANPFLTKAPFTYTFSIFIIIMN